MTAFSIPISMKLSYLSILAASLAAPAPEPTDARDATIYGFITSHSGQPDVHLRSLYLDSEQKFSINSTATGRPVPLQLGFANDEAYFYDYTQLPVGGLEVDADTHTVGVSKEATPDFSLDNSTGSAVLLYKGENNFAINLDTFELLAGGTPTGVSSKSVALVAFQAS